MRCPKCTNTDDKVIETRISREGDTIRRRRQCLSCSHRFTTYETVLPADIFVVKRDGRREEFKPEKLQDGIRLACWKRPVSQEAIDQAVADIINVLTLNSQGEVDSQYIGELVMSKLKQIDEVAYVRFASVYRRFQDADAFINEVQKLSAKSPNDAGAPAASPTGDDATTPTPAEDAPNKS
ncbi:MAG: transcriptional regulator NrdR [Lentisphaeria bacterium]|jgi:transcriptional repressor NrdR